MTRRTLIASLIFLVATITQAQWGPIVRLSETDSASSALYVSNPLLVSGNTVFAAWFDCYSGQPSLVYRRSTDRGASWGSSSRLTAVRPSTAQLALGGGSTIGLAYDSAAFMCFRRTTDNGANWSASETLAYRSSRGLLSMNTDGYGQFVWEDDDTLRWRRSTNGGAAWAGKAPLRGVASDNSIDALVSEHAPYAYLVFESNDSLMVSRTTDNGAHWGDVRCIVVASGIGDVLARVDDEGRMHLLWNDNHTGNYEVYYARSTDNGGTWSSPTRFTVSNASTPYWIDARGTLVLVSYQNLTTLKTRRRSFDGGASWEDESYWPCGSMRPIDCACLGEGSWVHLVSQQYIYPDGYFIGYYRSKDDGTSWPDSAIAVSETDQLNRNPRAIAASGGDVHVLWEDYKYGNYEIMYRRGVGLAGVEEQLAPVLSPTPPGPTLLPGVHAMRFAQSGLLFDAMGRRVLNPRPGVYFIRVVGDGLTAHIRKVVVLR